MQITADIGKISKTVPTDLGFTFDEVSEFVVFFVSNSKFLAVKNIVSFTQNKFLQKRDCVTMRNYA